MSRAHEADERRLAHLLRAKGKRYEMVYLDVSPDRRRAFEGGVRARALPALVAGGVYAGPFERSRSSRTRATSTRSWQTRRRATATGRCPRSGAWRRTCWRGAASRCSTTCPRSRPISYIPESSWALKARREALGVSNMK